MGNQFEFISKTIALGINRTDNNLAMVYGERTFNSRQRWLFLKTKL